MKVTFYGGAQGVTGSKHLVEIAGKQILLDCGMFQGHRAETRELNSRLPFDPYKIDAVVLSHGHLDHCGLLPLLVKLGYQGMVFATAATRDVAEWIMKDAAHIQAQDAMYMNKHLVPGAELAEPLFNDDDVDKVCDKFQAVPYVKDHSSPWVTIAEGVRLKLYDAGHILGSSVVLLEGREDGKVKRLAFTGDLGPKGTPLLKNPQPIDGAAETVLLECTYGGRKHNPLPEAIKRLANVITGVAQRKGKVVIPAFALGRTQELIYILHELTDKGLIPRVPIYVDSPLASRLTTVFTKHPENYDAEAWDEFGSRGELPLAFRNLKFVMSQDESRALNNMPGPFVVISSSGMCEAGRILHHLINSIEDEANVILITGFQAQHTLGRDIAEGRSQVKIFGQQYTVRAQVEVFNEFSAHADQLGLQEYVEGIIGIKNIFLIHGEPTNAENFSQVLHQAHPDWKIIVPTRGQSFVL